MPGQRSSFSIAEMLACNLTVAEAVEAEDSPGLRAISQHKGSRDAPRLML
jgi:hypothetical protein